MDIDPDSDYEPEERKSQQWVTTFNRYRNRLYASLAQACLLLGMHVGLYHPEPERESEAGLCPGVFCNPSPARSWTWAKASASSAKLRA
jgi:hypothetical protein